MLPYALMVLVVAVVAALLGVQGVAGLSAEVGYVLVSVAVIFMVIAFLSGAPLSPPQSGSADSFHARGATPNLTTVQTTHNEGEQR